MSGRRRAAGGPAGASAALKVGAVAVLEVVRRVRGEAGRLANGVEGIAVPFWAGPSCVFVTTRWSFPAPGRKRSRGAHHRAITGRDVAPRANAAAGRRASALSPGRPATRCQRGLNAYGPRSGRVARLRQSTPSKPLTRSRETGRLGAMGRTEGSGRFGGRPRAEGQGSFGSAAAARRPKGFCGLPRAPKR